MSLESEIKARFGGICNSIVVIFVVIVCLRFSSLAVAEGDLGEKFLTHYVYFLVRLVLVSLLGF